MNGRRYKPIIAGLTWMLAILIGIMAPLSVSAARRLSPAPDFVPGEASLTELRDFFQNGAYWNHISGTGNDSYSVTDTPCATGYGDDGLHADEGVVCNYFEVPGVVYGGWQCCGFVRMMTYHYFGSSCDSWETTTSLSDIKAGDVLLLENGGPHYIWLLSVTDNGDGTSKVTYTDCNGAGRRFHCQIQWDARCTVDRAAREVELAAIGAWDVEECYVSPGPKRTTLPDVFVEKESTVKIAYADGQGETTEAKTVTKDVKLPENTFIRKGYTFAGWTVKRNSDKTVWDGKAWQKSADKAAVLSAGDVLPLANLKRTEDESYTVTAAWKAHRWTLTYHPNGGAVTGDFVLVDEQIGRADTGKAVQDVWTYGAAFPTLPDAETFGLSRPGYRFVGWARKPSYKNTLTAAEIERRTESSDGEMTVYAVWVPVCAEVCYNTGGGEVMRPTYRTLSNGRIYAAEQPTRRLSRLFMDHGTADSLLPASAFGLFREGFHFAGWSLTAGGKPTTAQELFAAIADGQTKLVVYAAWTADTAKA